MTAIADRRAALQRRTIRVLIACQVLAGAGLAAGVVVGALLAEDMLGTDAYAGVPAALMTTGAAIAAGLIGRTSERHGRRPGLAAGYLVGAVGGAGVIAAATIDSVPLLLASFVLYGSGSATNLFARYAGADLAEPLHRGRAVSTVLVATTLGAVAGPNLVDVTGDLASSLGTRALVGPFLLASAAYALAALAVQILLRPDPLLMARELASSEVVAVETAHVADDDAPADGHLNAPMLLLASATMIVTQLVMVAIMTMTPVHMRDHGHGLGATGLVISIHIAAMFLPSPLTGQLVDRVGRLPLIVAAALTLIAAGLVAAIAPAASIWTLALGLALLGLGWNFGLIAGTALLTDSTPLARRSRTQGIVDVGVAIAGAAGGIGSGAVVSGASFAALSVGSAVIALLLLPLPVLLARRP